MILAVIGLLPTLEKVLETCVEKAPALLLLSATAVAIGGQAGERSAGEGKWTGNDHQTSVMSVDLV